MSVSKLYDSLNYHFSGETISAFIYNPYHYLVLLGLEGVGIQIDTLVLPSRLSESIQDLPKLKVRRTIVLRDSYKSDGVFWRIFSFPINLLTLFTVTGRYPLLTANDRSLLVSAWGQMGRGRSIPVLDEGALAQILFREKENTDRHRGLVERLFGRYPRLANPKTNLVLTEDPHLQQLLSSIAAINIQDLVHTSLSQIAGSVSNCASDFGNSLLLVTSPLTENKNVGSVSEVLLIEQLLVKNPTKNFYWSRHYRESKGKYDSLLEMYSNFHRLPAAFDALPGQSYASLFQGLIGFHSSLLVQEARQGQNVYSLSALVDSAHALAFVQSEPPGLKFLADAQISVN